MPHLHYVIEYSLRIPPGPEPVPGPRTPGSSRKPRLARAPTRPGRSRPDLSAAGHFALVSKDIWKQAKSHWHLRCQRDRGQSKNGTIDGNSLSCPPIADTVECGIYCDAETNGSPTRTALAFTSFQLSGRAPCEVNTSRHSPCVRRPPDNRHRPELGDTFHSWASAFAASDNARFFASTGAEVPARCTIGVLYCEALPLRPA